MRLTIRISIAAVTVLFAAQLFGAAFAPGNRIVREFPIDPAGSIWIENPFGTVEVIGGEGKLVSVTADRVITAPDAASMKDAADSVGIDFKGDTKALLMWTVFPPAHNARWNVAVNYVVRVPRGVSVKVDSKLAEHIRVSHLSGGVTINGFAGTVILDDVAGASSISMVNGRIVYDYAQRPVSKAVVQAVNADIDIYLPPNSSFDWIANTINGDILTTFPVRGGRFSGTIFHGTVGSGGPTIDTTTMMGRILVQAKGTKLSQAQSVRVNQASHQPVPGDVLLQPPVKIQLPFVNGDFNSAASVADVTISEVRGNAHIVFGAGRVELGAVYGQCNVTSMGGPLNLGDIIGALFAHTGAGDIYVRVARMGGQVTTDGGTIRVIVAGGPMTLRSGGGDIIVRQASAAIDAETTSGDVTLTADPKQKTLKATARTLQGNIILNVSPHFAADIDATILTSDPDVNEMHIDFNGISVRREQVGNKTRIHATGKINGGGERVELYAEEGDIHISAHTITPIKVASPKR
ncbi:MAG TPA: DUF4097 family beta strand repeat-containing protein [Thermoanaerobaculia bacterium]|jgi:DUF4097 and DUF4098 domain-containing protein YvlB|nr:DUF4097 family beta strand repeat-containing protein [Thermoanaerobaculia bacterium]